MNKADSSILEDDNQIASKEEAKGQDNKPEDADMKNEETDVIEENFKGRIRSIITYTGSDG